MNKVENQISRMKAMMSYGLTTEGKNKQYKSVEYQRLGADGKMYGIVREGTNFFIKVSDKTKNVLKEDFDYIGGFVNRKNNQYSSYANALKHFDLNMASLKEAINKKGNIVIESWNPDKKEQLAVEATDKMRREIERQRQIMSNVYTIEENKNYSVSLDEDCCGNTCGKSCGKVDSECAKTQKNNIKKGKNEAPKGKGKGGDPFTKNAEAEMAKTQKGNMKNQYKPIMSEGEQVLGWNDNEDYLDTAHGTNIGDSAPFDKSLNSKDEMDNGTVEEGTAMHAEGENQNSPAVGTSKIGDKAPFNKTVKEGIEDDDMDDVEDDDMDTDVDSDFEDDDMDTDVDSDFDDDADMDTDVDTDSDFDDDADSDFDDEFSDTDDTEDVDDEFDDDTETRLSTIEDMLTKIADKLGVDEFEDDDLYDDEEDDDFDSDEDEDLYDSADENNDFGSEDDEDFDSEDDEDTEVFESRSYRKAMLNEDRLDYFGKHPAYRKEPMKHPSNKHQEKEGYWDINDESTYDESEYGRQIGSSAPFEVNPDEITDAIAESIQRNLRRKKK